MSDSPVRPGPPVPHTLAGTPATDAAASPARGANRASPAARPGPAIPPGMGRTRPIPRRAGRQAASPSVPVTATPLARTIVVSSGMQRLGVIALVLALVFGAVWMDRDRHDPVPPYGIVPQPATTTVPVLDSAPTAGDPAPNFRLLATNGDVVELADLRGQPLVIHFWTTWCLECAPELSALQQAESDQGIQVVGIAVGETSDRVDQAADTGGASYPMLLDRDKEVSHYYGVWDYPATLVIDADGVIGSVTMGPISPEDLQRQLDSVLET